MKITRRQLKKMIAEAIFVDPGGVAVDSDYDYIEDLASSYQGTAPDKIKDMLRSKQPGLIKQAATLAQTITDPNDSNIEDVADRALDAQELQKSIKETEKQALHDINVALNSVLRSVSTRKALNKYRQERGISKATVTGGDIIRLDNTEYFYFKDYLIDIIIRLVKSKMTPFQISHLISLKHGRAADEAIRNYIEFKRTKNQFGEYTNLIDYYLEKKKIFIK